MGLAGGVLGRLCGDKVEGWLLWESVAWLLGIPSSSRD